MAVSASVVLEVATMVATSAVGYTVVVVVVVVVVSTPELVVAIVYQHTDMVTVVGST